MSIFLQKRIKGLFSTANMIMFSGNMSFDPNTLNNNISTYIFARQLQNHNYPYENWIELIKKCHDRGKLDDVFNDWSVYGNGMVLPQFNITAKFDQSLSEPIQKILKPQQSSDPKKKDEYFQASSLRGMHAGCIADMDPDMQMMSKYFSNQLIVCEAVSIKFKTVSFNQLNQRVLNGTDRRTNWYAEAQKIEIINSANLEKIPALSKMIAEVNSNSNKKGLGLKFNQFRYNQVTKNSYISGFFEVFSKQSQAKNDTANERPGIISNNWRMVKMLRIKDGEQTLSPFPFFITMKNVQYSSDNGKKGILIDISDAAFDQNNLNNSPVYPTNLTIELSENRSNGKQFPSIKLDAAQVQNIFQKQGGLFLLENEQLPLDKIIVKIKQQWDPIVMPQDIKFSWFVNSKIQGIQADVTFEVVDRFKKSELKTTVENGEFNDQIQFQVYCQKLGVPYSGQYTMELKPPIFNTISDFYKCAITKEDYDTVFTSQEDQQILKVGDTNVFDILNRTNNESKQNLFLSNGVNYWRVGQWSEMNGVRKFTPKGDEYFQMQFAHETNQSQQNNPYLKKITFSGGVGKFKVKLNYPLTDMNNPRTPAMESLALTGRLTLYDPNQKQTAINTDFSTIFFQNHTKKLRSTDIDWVNVIGPKLRTYAMMYPAMQRIANIYDFNLSMDSMKRAFDVQNIQHSRYMPSTRQMSPVQHRQIRKWLYFPHYNRKYNQRISQQNVAKKFQFLNGYTVEKWKKLDKMLKKQKVVELIKGAWRLELITMTLYLGAMFSLKKGSDGWKHIYTVAKDEMKHLFIVSNMLNALGGDVPFDNNDYIPCYPMSIPGAFKTTNKKLECYTKFNIQPANYQQLLKFIMIEMPTETDLLRLSDEGIQDQQTCKRIQTLRCFLNDLTEQLGTNPQFVNIGQYYNNIIDRLWELNDEFKGSEYLLFSGDANKQFTYFYLNDMSPIYDFRSLINQVRLIVQEGQGANVFDLKGELHKESHFFKFMEVYTGCQIKEIKGVKVGDQNYAKESVIYFEKPSIKSANPQTKCQYDKTRTKKVEDWISEEYKSMKTTSRNGQQYPNIFARSAFTNVYAKILQEFYFIFKASPRDFLNLHRYDNEAALNKFEAFRRRRMQNAIGKMKQMTMHGLRIVEPNQIFHQERDAEMASAPNFNVYELMEQFKRNLDAWEKSRKDQVENS